MAVVAVGGGEVIDVVVDVDVVVVGATVAYVVVVAVVLVVDCHSAVMGVGRAVLSQSVELVSAPRGSLPYS